MTFNPQKFDALVDYLLWKSGPMEEEKLRWLLMRCDFLAFGELGNSITGATYVRGEFWPIIVEDDGAEICFDKWEMVPCAT